MNYCPSLYGTHSWLNPLIAQVVLNVMQGSDRSVCAVQDRVRMWMCWGCSCFSLSITMLLLTFTSEVFVHLSPFVTQFYTYTHLQLRFKQDNFVLTKGEVLYSSTCCLCKCIDAWHARRNSFLSVPPVLFVSKKQHMHSSKCWKANIDVIN